MEVPSVIPVVALATDHPLQIDQHEDRSTSVLARVLCTTLPDLSEIYPTFEPLAVHEKFEAPQFSTAFLQRLHRATIKENSHCKHGMLRICCAICKEQNDGDCVDARGTAKAYKERKRHKKDDISPNAHYPSERVAREVTHVAFPHVPNDPPERLSITLQKLFQSERRFNQVTPEDVAWGERASLRHHTVQKKKVTEVWCKTCVERTVLTTIAGVQITLDRRGTYVEQTHECGARLVDGDEALPTLDYGAFVARRNADLHAFQAFQRTRSKDYLYSREARYFQFVKEDLLNPKSEEQSQQFWLDMGQSSCGKRKRHYVRHGAKR